MPCSSAVSDLNAQLQAAETGPVRLPTISAALADLKRSTSDQYADLSSQIAAGKGKPKVSLDNGRLTVASADGRFQLSRCAAWSSSTRLFRARHAIPPRVDLNSGSNFRRAQFGFGHRLARLVLQFHL